MKIWVLDVGQGDAIYIHTPNDRHILVDAGKKSFYSDSGKQVLLPFFKQVGVKSLDAVLLSHPHADHIGGMVSLLSELDIKRIYHIGRTHISDVYKNYTQLAWEKQIPCIAVAAGDELFIDQEMRWRILWPTYNADQYGLNNSSMVVRVDYGKTSFMFTGDIEAVIEKKLSKYYQEALDTDFLKVAHHASKTSSTEEFLSYNTPGIAVVSLADKNKYRFPHIEAVKRLVTYSEKIWYTSLEYAMYFSSDGKRITRHSFK